MRTSLTALCLIVASCSSTEELAAPSATNVILIMTDDQGWGDFGFQGTPAVKTPSLDRLAAASARMDTFYVSPVCTPTRAALMTGRWTQRSTAIDTYIGRAMLRPEETTLAEALRDAGWATGIFGKWHLGDCYPMRAMDQGFEEALVHRGGGIGQPSDPEGGEGKYTDAILEHNGERVATEGYCTDVYFDAAWEWLANAHEVGQPFFAYIATNAPHGPFHDVPTELYGEYRAADLSRFRSRAAGEARRGSTRAHLRDDHECRRERRKAARSARRLGRARRHAHLVPRRQRSELAPLGRRHAREEVRGL